jgi:uncharacterized protein YyaL (SSP411 family)
MTNRLAREKSPYLKQHAENPVDWRPWGGEALDKARAEDKPIFLSIGYSSCHWCHVMARESFSDDEVAAILNEGFIAVKVDREERPDIDALYMAACQALGGQGGWPLSIFLTPSGRPFFAGTYFPKRTRGSTPGFIEVLSAVARMWAVDRERIDAVGNRVTEILRREAAAIGEVSPLGPEVFDAAFFSLRSQFDDRNGGFGRAPKFPMPHRLSFLLRYHRATGNDRALEMVCETLRQMRYGGIFDQIGLGFHRYSVDERWRVPHFEKMLSDQALTASAYIEAFLVTGDLFFARTAREIFAYVLRDMTSDEGGFFTAEDAESDSEEGTYYLWTRDEIERLLGAADADLAAGYFGIRREGNIPVPGFADGMNIPYVPLPPDRFADRKGMETDRLFGFIESARQRLSAARENRVRPKRDDKIVTALNGLMIGALAMGYRALGETAYLDAAVAAARFVSEALSDGSIGLLRRYRDGGAGIGGFLEDYAFFIWGLIELYEACLDVQYLQQAQGLARVMVERFEDREAGGLFTTPRDGERLIADTKEIYDGAAPCPNSVAADNLLRLYGLTGDVDFSRAADRILGTFSERIGAHPDAGTRFLAALERSLGPTQEIVIVGRRESESTRKMIKTIHGLFLPTTSLLFVPEGDDDERRRVEQIVPFVSGMKMRRQRATAYICRRHTCHAPLTDPDSVRAALVGAGWRETGS